MSNLLIKKTSAGETLEALVSILPGIVGCGPWEERESSNYPEYHYFRCLCLGLELTISIADDSEFRDYDFDLHVGCEYPQENDSFLSDLADCAARKLVLSGCEILRPLDSSRIGKGGMVYRLDPAKGTTPWQQVSTELLKEQS